jgi:predicted permease
MNMTSVISRMAVLFIILAIGYLAAKMKVLTADSSKVLSKLVLYITLPCTVLSSVTSIPPAMKRSDALVFMLFVIISFAVMFLIAAPIPRLLRAPIKDRGLYCFIIAFANVGFMGYPVVAAIFGPDTAFYVTLYNIPFNLLLFTVGVLLMPGGSGKINARKVLLSPTLIASVIAVLIFVLERSLPGVVADAAALVGSMTTPCAMLVIGITLAAIPLREVFSELRIYPLVFIRLILVPVVLWLAFKPFMKDAVMLGILIVEAGMPTGTSVAMFSLEYGGNEKLASKSVFLTTVLSLATIPLLVFLLL